MSPGEILMFTSDNSEYPCTMVESNGRAYKSHKWQSIIEVKKPKHNGFVTVMYELFCQEGQ